MTRIRIGTNQRRLLLLLQAGVAIALSGSPRSVFKITRAVHRELGEIAAAELRASIRRLYQSRLIDVRDHPDGSTTILLTAAGRQKALTYKLDEIKIRRPPSWDHRWRLIIFDIPEKRRRLRDALRHHLRRLGCHELQKSVFIHPFECRDEIDFLIEFYQTRPFVRFIVADEIDNAPHLKNKFRL